MKESKVKATRGNTYQITAAGAKQLADATGQGAIIRDCVVKGGPMTAAAIVDKVGKALKTPSPAKTVAFYLCVWKADGLVKFGPSAKKGK